MELKNNTLLRDGNYRILNKLGQGSFGITYLAEHTALGKKVAIKEFFMKDINSRSDDGSITGITDGSLSYNYGQKFKREALNLAKLEHPNIVRVTDCFDENSTYYYVMDFIEGENLNDYIKSHTISEDEAIAIIKDVASALTYMHDQHHMLHLDLKPGNIMRRASDGHIFLIDFGLSKHYNNDGQPETSTTIGLGTLGYAPIEQGNQARGGEFRPTIDVYALGATLYKLLTDETPPAASDVLADKETLSNKLKQKGISQSVKNLVMEAMEPVANKRIPTVNEFSRRLTEINSIPPTPKGHSDFSHNSENARITDPNTEETKVASNHEQVEQKHQAPNVNSQQADLNNNKQQPEKKKKRLRIVLGIVGFLVFAGLVSGVVNYLTEHNKQVQFEKHISNFNDLCPINTDFGVLTKVETVNTDPSSIRYPFVFSYTMNDGISMTGETTKDLWKRTFLGSMNQPTKDFINFIITSGRDINFNFNGQQLGKPNLFTNSFTISNTELKNMLEIIEVTNVQINAEIQKWKKDLPQYLNDEDSLIDFKLDGDTVTYVHQMNENTYMLDESIKTNFRNNIVLSLQSTFVSFPKDELALFNDKILSTGKCFKFQYRGTKSMKVIDIVITNIELGQIKDSAIKSFFDAQINSSQQQ